MARRAHYEFMSGVSHNTMVALGKQDESSSSLEADVLDLQTRAAFKDEANVFTESQTIDVGAANLDLHLASDDGFYAVTSIEGSGNVSRWNYGKSAADDGFIISRFDTGGILVDLPINISWDTGVVDFEHTPTVDAVPVVLRGDKPWTLINFNAGAGVGNEAADTAAFNAFLASGEDVLEINPVQFELDDATYTIPAGTTIFGHGPSSILFNQDTGSTTLLLKLGGDNIHLRDFVVRGPQDTIVTAVENQRAISNVAQDTDDPGSDFEGFQMSGMEVYGFAGYGLLLARMSNTVVERNYLHNLGRVGIMLAGGSSQWVLNNRIATIAPGLGSEVGSFFVNAYGISITSDGFGIGFGKNTNVFIIGNRITDIPTWKAIDFHAGDYGVVAYNQIEEVAFGIAIERSSNNNNESTKGIICVHNILKNSTANDYHGAGINVEGVVAEAGPPVIAEDFSDNVIVAYNFLDGFGTSQDSFDDPGGADIDGAINCRYARHVTIAGNSIRNWYGEAINLEGDIDACSIYGNVIGDGNTTESQQSAIYVEASSTTQVHIGCNTIRRTTGTMTGIEVTGSAPSDPYGVKLDKQNMLGVPTPLATGSFALLHNESTYEITGTNTTDLGSIAADTTIDMDITVTGAAYGDRVIHAYISGNDGLGLVHGFVSAADTVTVGVWNPTGSPIDPGSRTYTAVVSKRGV